MHPARRVRVHRARSQHRVPQGQRRPRRARLRRRQGRLPHLDARGLRRGRRPPRLDQAAGIGGRRRHRRAASRSASTSRSTTRWPRTPRIDAAPIARCYSADRNMETAHSTQGHGRPDHARPAQRAALPPLRDPAAAPRAAQVVRGRQDPRPLPGDRGARGRRLHRAGRDQPRGPAPGADRVPDHRRKVARSSRTGSPTCSPTPVDGDPGLQRRGRAARVHHPGARRGGARKPARRAPGHARRASTRPCVWPRTTSDSPASCCSSSNMRWRSRRRSSTWVRSIIADMQSGALVWNEELIRAHFEAMHAADAARRNHRETTTRSRCRVRQTASTHTGTAREETQ